MMKYKAGALGVLLAGFLLFPVSAQAAQEEVELQVNGSQAEVIIRLPESQTDMITSLQLGFTVSVANGTEDTELVFDFSDEVDSTVQEYRYRAEKGTLNLYVSGRNDLFDAEDNELKLGTVSLKNGTEDTSAELTVRPGSFKLVNRVNSKIDTETFENFVPVTIGDTEDEPGSGTWYDTTLLSQTVEKAAQTDLSLYEDGEIKDAFIRKLTDAKELLSAPTSQEAVDQMTEELEAAMEALETVRIDEKDPEPIPTEPPTVTPTGTPTATPVPTGNPSEIPTPTVTPTDTPTPAPSESAGGNNPDSTTEDKTPVPAPSGSGGSGSSNGGQGSMTSTTVSQNSNSSAGNQSSVSKTETVKTGDSSRIGVWAGVFVSGAMMLFLLLFAGKKKGLFRK